MDRVGEKPHTMLSETEGGLKHYIMHKKKPHIFQRFTYIRDILWGEEGRIGLRMGLKRKS